MQIKSIDNTNFQMALKLNPEKMPAKLKEKPIEYILSLNEFGNKIKDIKLYDVVFEDSFIPQVNSANPKMTEDFFAALKNEEQYLGKWYQRVGSDEVSGGCYPKEPHIFRVIYGKDASKEYSKFKKMGDLEQAGELSRLLEQRDLKNLLAEKRKQSEQNFQNLVEKAKKEQLNKEIDSLMNRYGAEAETPKKAEKKGFFSFLFPKK